MYRKFYGIEEKPFDLTPDGDFFYLSETHREGMATLRYGVIADKGFLMLTGGVGTGKTTVVNALLRMLKEKVRLCVLNNPKLDKHEFFHYLAKELNLRYAGNKGRFILEFSRLLDICQKKNEKVLLIIDEAQVFPVELMEEIRLLSNHAGERNVLGIFLVGQPELQGTLADPRLLPLRQRIGIHYHLSHLSKTDTAQYIVYRLNKAGAANPALFTERAIGCIHDATQGNPRLINIICDHALISGFTLELNQIDRDVILRCIEEIKLPSETKLRFSEVSRQQEPIGLAIPDQGNKKSKLPFVVLGVALLAVIAGVLYYSFSYGWLYTG